jgi:hypothetical protein
VHLAGPIILNSQMLDGAGNWMFGKAVDIRSVVAPQFFPEKNRPATHNR